MTLDELEQLAKAATPGPYYVSPDDADECGPHKDSGLSLVDTGRRDDWSIARLCETPSANFIAACSPERILAMIECIRAADAYLISNNPMDFGCACEVDYMCGPCRARNAQAPLYSARAKLNEAMK